MIKEIGIYHGPFKEKFGTPRQPGLVKAAQGTIQLHPEYAIEEAFRGIEGFSHLWLIFQFHQAKDWSPTVRPPRLGGNTRMGVFATRSPFRPNNLGLSLVENKGISKDKSHVMLHVAGADLVDGTPIFDIKPYLPEVECIPNATAGWTDSVTKKELLTVEFSELALKQIAEQKKYKKNHLMQLITEVLSLDPRPSYMNEKTSKNNFANRIYEFDVHWKVSGQKVFVTTIKRS